MIRDNMKHVCACVLGVVLLCVSTTAHAVIDWDESWEYANNQAWIDSPWTNFACTATTMAGIAEISSERAFSGTKSMKMTYIGHNPPTTCWMDRFYGAKTDVLYTRIYMFLDNFTADPTNTKLYTHSDTHSYPAWWWSVYGSTNKHRVGLEGTTLGAAGSLIESGTIPIGRWVCVETEVRMNTPGLHDGIIRSWVDGAPRINRTDVKMRNATNTVINGTPPNENINGPTSGMLYTRMYRQWGTGVIYFDRYAVSRDARIGCLGAQTDTTPPARPANFVVN
jgi:hypothetical protein